ncbi:hypothetical protein [Actinoplanes utahensis]|uniref:Uncharacterized protein n=1 Tax=Actinoplanes utahensis TaxID=1869 RepID=A0A0A6UL93_ACTUT|nr:hypothetical protein [Actinoplanes utahensis]KHD75813.1 hypothetical protein MB27_20435 [Actinoplanes utahensis]GIF32209.1 hypothetical protein Aut01nite_51950 [Actinoplanes utahensis]
MPDDDVPDDLDEIMLLSQEQYEFLRKAHEEGGTTGAGMPRTWVFPVSVEMRRAGRSRIVRRRIRGRGAARLTGPVLLSWPP